MNVLWQQLTDGHRWTVKVGKVLRLDVSPYIDDRGITYTALVSSMSLEVLYRSANHVSVDEAKREALDMARLVVRELTHLLKEEKQ